MGSDMSVDLGTIVAAIAAASAACGVTAAPPRAPEPAPLAPVVVVVEEEVNDFDWHNEYTLFEDGSGWNADGISFCVWHEQALCSPRSPSEVVPAGAQLEFARVAAETVPASP